MMASVMNDKLSGPRNRWENIGTSVYRKGDVYVWKENGKWWRTDLPVLPMRAALRSVAIRSPLGIFSENSGPYKTMRAAKRSRRR